MQEGRRINGPAAWRYRIGGTGREISMLSWQCKERFSDIFQHPPGFVAIPPFPSGYV
jgi:hypothetical protein